MCFFNDIGHMVGEMSYSKTELYGLGSSNQLETIGLTVTLTLELLNET